MKRPNWFTRLALMFYGPAQNSPIDEPRTSPESNPGSCPRCGQLFSNHAVRRVGSKNFTQCPTEESTPA